MNTSKFVNHYGPWAVVTGASDGIGKEFAAQLAAMGLNLVLVARREDRLRELAATLEANHKVCTRVAAIDLGEAEGRKRLWNATADLDVGLLVAAAGFGTSGPLLQADWKTERNMLEVNCHAVLEQCIHFGERLAKRGHGGVILMGSLLAWQGVPTAAHYAATKAYVQSLAEALRLEWAPLGIDILVSAPGPVKSGFAQRADMRMGMAESPATVATQSLNALGRRGTVIPGAFSKLLTYSLTTLPRFLRTRMLGQIMGNMTRHQLQNP